MANRKKDQPPDIISELENENKKDLQTRCGERIIKIREWEGLTQETLAEELNTTPQTISLAERGAQMLSPEHARKITQKYGYSLDWIYGISKTPKTENRKYYVDIREIISIKDNAVHVKLPSDLYEYLRDLGNLQKRRIDKQLTRKEVSILHDELDRDLHSHGTDCFYWAETDIEKMKLKLKLNHGDDIDICT